MSNYSQIKSFTKNMGSAGGQIQLGYIEPIDNDSMFGYLNNVVVTALINEGDGDNGGMLFYLSSNSSWNDSDVLAAKGIPGYGGSVSLSAKRKVTGQVEHNRPDGRVYIYGECTDLTVTTDVSVRIVLEAWGRFITLVEA